MSTTLNCGTHEAVICRERGWGVGTRLMGDEGHGLTVIEITAVGEMHILAKSISHNGFPSAWGGETIWALDCRDWQAVT